MPLFMDVHQIASGVAMDDVARAHLADLQIQSVQGDQDLAARTPERLAGPS